MRNEGLSYFAAGLPCSGKLLFCYILALGLGFMGGINIVPELVLLICCGLCLANLHVGFPSPQGLQGLASSKNYLCCLFDSADIHLLFDISPVPSSFCLFSMKSLLCYQISY
jgi:hypothetical protein